MRGSRLCLLATGGSSPVAAYAAWRCCDLWTTIQSWTPPGSTNASNCFGLALPKGALQRPHRPLHLHLPAPGAPILTCSKPSVASTLLCCLGSGYNEERTFRFAVVERARAVAQNDGGEAAQEDSPNGSDQTTQPLSGNGRPAGATALYRHPDVLPCSLYRVAGRRGHRRDRRPV